MMLSICITARDVALNELITRLKEQAEKLDVDTEICVAESASKSSISRQNEALCNNLNIKYIRHNQYWSHGQMKNMLAQQASGSYLLFVHGSMHITHRKFLSSYTEVMQPGVVVHGGVSASGRRPAPDYELHWLAMHNLLTYTSDERNKHPYYHLCTNNMMIPRGLFLQYPTPDSDDFSGLLPYSFELKNNKIPVIHIDNPIATSRFLETMRFLAITRMQMQQIACWIKKLSKEEMEHVAIPEYRHLLKAKKWKMAPLLKNTYKLNAARLFSDNYFSLRTSLRMYKHFRRWMLIKYIENKKMAS